jgi:hypothetical protein
MCVKNVSQNVNPRGRIKSNEFFHEIFGNGYLDSFDLFRLHGTFWMVRFQETGKGTAMYKLVGMLRDSLLGSIDNGTLPHMQATKLCTSW